MSILFHIKRLKRNSQRRMNIERRRIRDLSDPLDIPEDEFVRRYRLNHRLFLDLCDLLHPFMRMAERSSAIPFEMKILATLSFCGTESYQCIVGYDSAFSMSQPSVSRCVKMVVNALNMVLNPHVTFPCTPHDRILIKQGFYRKCLMPGVIGCIDGTHIAIIAPKNHPSEPSFFNRKGYHSINAVIICDSDLIIRGINARFGGASHDTYIWNTMSLNTYIRQIYENGEPGWLLGDSGFPQWLMTPILNTEEGSPEAHYTKKHILVRNCVERCIGVLKSRWRCLLRHRTLNYDPDICGKIINMCAVLHNICVKANIEAPQIEEEEEGPLPEHVPSECKHTKCTGTKFSRQKFVGKSQ